MSSTTPYMTLILPTVTVTIGPEWATELNAAMTRVDAHDHAPGNGVQITPSGLNINADLPFGSTSSITAAKSLGFTQQASALAPSFVERLYDVLGDLYWNDKLGNQIQITSAGALNAAGLTPTTWPSVNVVTDKSIAPSDTYAVLMIDTGAARLITLPLANAVSKGRFYQLIDTTGGAASFAITVAPNGGGSDQIDGFTAGAAITLRTNHGRWRFISDGVSKWFVERDSHEVNGIGVTMPGGSNIAVGNGLYGTGVRNAQWSALNLAGGANYVTGLLPAANLPDATTAPAKGVIQLATDLGGTATAPTVIQLTGAAGVVSVVAAALNFVDGISPAIQQVARATSGSGSTTSLTAQNANTSGDGGGITLTTGNAAGAGKKGPFTAKIGTSYAFEAKEVRAGQRVFAIGGITSVTTTEIPVAAPSGGDGIIYIRNAPTPPVIGNQPVGGGVMYSSAGRFGWLGTTFGVGFEIDGSTSASATAGFAALPGNPDSFLQINVGGTNFRIPLYRP